MERNLKSVSADISEPAPGRLATFREALRIFKCACIETRRNCLWPNITARPVEPSSTLTLSAASFCANIADRRSNRPSMHMSRKRKRMTRRFRSRKRMRALPQLTSSQRTIPPASWSFTNARTAVRKSSPRRRPLRPRVYTATVRSHWKAILPAISGQIMCCRSQRLWMMSRKSI